MNTKQRRNKERVKMKNFIKKFLIPSGLLILAGCLAFSGKIIREEMVTSIPDKKYEKIIKMNTWDMDPLQPEAGFVYVEPEGKVTTDFPRVEFMKSIDPLNQYSQQNRKFMAKFVIKDSKGKVRGYYELLHGYTATVWEREDGILLQITIPDNSINIHRTGDDRKPGGKHGGR